MNVIEDLRNTSKGKLKYDTNWRGTRQELDECSQSPRISCHVGLIQDIKNLSLKDNDTIQDTRFQSETTSASSSGESCFNSSKVGPECFDSTHVSLFQYELMMKQKVKEKVEERKKLFEQHSYRLHEEKTRTLQQQLEERRNRFLEVVQVLQQDLRKYEKQAAKKQEALILQHEKYAANTIKKVQMLELRKKQAEEEARNRRDLASLQKCHNETNHVYNELEAAIKRCSLKDHLEPKMDTIKEEANKVFNLSENTLNDCISAGKALDGALEHMPEYHKIMKTLLSNALQTITAAEEKAKKEMAEREAKKKEEEQLKKLEEEREKKEIAAKKSESLSTTISSSSIPEYTRLEKLLEEVNKSVEPLTSSTDKSIKKLRMALQRAVTTPINTISDQSPSHLLDKISNLSRLLSGQQIESFRNVLSTTVHPSGSLYCKNLLARKVVQQGSQQVSSNHNAAFPLAALVIGIWSIFPDVGDLILAHFYNQCPFLVPMYIPQTEGMPDREYFQKLGYLCEDGEIEARDKYLKRISGTIRLYAAIVSSLPPRGSTTSHPHGVSHAWMWLARILNLQPKSDYTATALFEFLDVAGHALQQQYHGQFWKLIIVIVKQLIPRIRQITAPSQSGPVVRLESFLEKAFQARSMQKPTGYLDAHWWNTTGFSGIYGKIDM